jgi:hypothetical protein
MPCYDRGEYSTLVGSQYKILKDEWKILFEWSDIVAT